MQNNVDGCQLADLHPQGVHLFGAETFLLLTE
jgi:hypothetical protein